MGLGFCEVRLGAGTCQTLLGTLGEIPFPSLGLSFPHQEMRRLVSLEFLTGYFHGLWFGTDPVPVTLPHSDPMFSALLQGNFGEAGPAGQQVSVLGIGQLWAEGNVEVLPAAGGGGDNKPGRCPA